MMDGDLSYSYDEGISTFRLSFPAVAEPARDEESPVPADDSVAVPTAS